MPVNPHITAMPTAPYSRESAAKGDDQIAYENAVSCEEVGRYQSALEWYAEVKLTGNRWDRAASMSRVALLVALNRGEEAVNLGMKAVMRMNRPSPGLIAEVARAWNQHIGPTRALDFCRHWLSRSPACRTATLWFSAAAYAAQSQQFARSLRYIGHCLDLCGDTFGGDLFLDFDFAPLWQHLAHDPLTAEDAAALSRSVWQTQRDVLAKMHGSLSFESIGHVPLSMRSMLHLHTPSMTWQPHARATPSQLVAFTSWCEAVRQRARQSLAEGLIKALAQQPATSGECA
jgi:hypothetical protein